MVNMNEKKKKKYPISFPLLCLLEPTLSIIYQFLFAYVSFKWKISFPFHSIFFSSIFFIYAIFFFSTFFFFFFFLFVLRRFCHRLTLCAYRQQCFATCYEYLDSIIICSLFFTVSTVRIRKDTQCSNECWIKFLSFATIYVYYERTKKPVLSCLWHAKTHKHHSFGNDDADIEVAVANKVEILKDLRVSQRNCVTPTERRREREQNWEKWNKNIWNKCHRNWRIRWIDPITLIGKRARLYRNVVATVAVLASDTQTMWKYVRTTGKMFMWWKIYNLNQFFPVSQFSFSLSMLHIHFHRHSIFMKKK